MSERDRVDAGVPPGGASAAAAVDVVADRRVRRRFSWGVAHRASAVRVRFDVDVFVRLDAVAHWAERNPRHPTHAPPDFSPWLAELGPEVRAIADAIETTARAAVTDRSPIGLCTAAAIVFVQRLPYEADLDGMGVDEHWRFPVETIHDGRGDCEDATILLLALLHVLRVPAVPIWHPGHVAVGLLAGAARPDAISVDGQRIRYVETTTVSPIGWIPEAYDPAQLRICRPVVGRPHTTS